MVAALCDPSNSVAALGEPDVLKPGELCLVSASSRSLENTLCCGAFDGVEADDPVSFIDEGESTASVTFFWPGDCGFWPVPNGENDLFGTSNASDVDVGRSDFTGFIGILEVFDGGVYKESLIDPACGLSAILP